MTDRSLVIALLVAFVLPSLLAGCFSVPAPAGAAGETPETAAGVSAVVTHEFCVVTTDRVHELPLVIRGTRFSAGGFDPARPALVLTHGASSTRAYLDGWWLYERLTGDDSLARTLAAAGVNVFTFDRPGYGDSIWDRVGRDGRSLGTQAQIDAMRDVVGAVRDGSYLIMEHSCGNATRAAAPSATVLLGGHSLGGALTRMYLGEVGDVDGAIVLHWSSPRPSNAIVNAFAECSTEDPTTTYFHALCRPEHYRYLLAPEILDRDVVASMVDYARIPKDPRGLVDAGVTVSALDAQIARTPAIPVLLVNGAQDYAFVEVDTGGSHMEEDRFQWKYDCACDATYWVQPGAGHFPFLMERRADMFAGVIQWLAEEGFIAEPSHADAAVESVDLDLHDCAVGRWFFFIPESTARSLLPAGFAPTDAAVAFRTLNLPVPHGLPATGRAVGAYDTWSCPSSSLGGGPLGSSGVYVLVEPPILPGFSAYPPATQDLYIVSYGLATQNYRDLMAPWLPFEVTPEVKVTFGFGAAIGVGPHTGSARVSSDSAALMESMFAGVQAPSVTDIDARFRAWYVQEEGTMHKDFLEVGPVWAGGVVGCRHAAGSAYARVSGTEDCRSNAGGVFMSVDFDAPARVEFHRGAFPTAPRGL